MQTVHFEGTTTSDGTLSMSIPLPEGNTAYKVVIVAEKVAPVVSPADIWKEVDDFRNKLAATGRFFRDSVEDLRELREERLDQW